MERRALERAFARAHGDEAQRTAATEEQLRAASRASTGAKDSGTTVQSTISRILKAWSDKEYFLLLDLPQPIADELGKPTWPCTATDVSKAYRRLSVLVHPDKHPGADARAAFEALNDTHRMLKDPSRLEQVLKDVSGRALTERERLDAKAAAESGHAAMAAVRNEAMQRLRKQEGAAFGQEILAQVKARQAEAARKAAAVARARVTDLHSQEEREEQDLSADEKLGTHILQRKRAAEGSGDEDDGDGGGVARRRAMAARAATTSSRRKKLTMLH